MNRSSSPLLTLGGIPFRMCLMFAMNPDETLQTGDVALKYGIAFHSVPSTLSTAARDGWLTKVAPSASQRRHGGQSVYSAGPELLKLIGKETA